MLCSVQLNQLTQSLGKLDLQIGTDFQILTVSIDPKETTQTIRETKRSVRGPIDQGSASAWTRAGRFAPLNNRSSRDWPMCSVFDTRTIARVGEYYHPAMLAFVSPDGVITRYSLAVAFEPADLKKALIEAGDGTVGSPVDQLVLWCFSYDPTSNSYVPQAWRIMRLGGAATVGLMLACLAPYWIGRKRSPAQRTGEAEEAEEEEIERTDSHPE